MSELLDKADPVARDALTGSMGLSVLVKLERRRVVATQLDFLQNWTPILRDDVIAKLGDALAHEDFTNASTICEYLDGKKYDCLH